MVCISKNLYRIEILQNYKIYTQIIKIMSSRWSSSLHFPLRNSDQMTIGKTHPTLHFLYNCWTMEKWYRLSGRSVSSIRTCPCLFTLCPNKLFLVSVRLNIEHSMKLIGRTSNKLLKITNKSINISEIFIEKNVFWGLDEVWNYSWRGGEL